MFDEFDGRNSLFAAFSFFAALVPTSVLISNPWVDDYFVDGIRSTVAVACGIVIGIAALLFYMYVNNRFVCPLEIGLSASS